MLNRLQIFSAILLFAGVNCSVVPYFSIGIDPEDLFKQDQMNSIFQKRFETMLDFSENPTIVKWNATSYFMLTDKGFFVKYPVTNRFERKITKVVGLISILVYNKPLQNPSSIQLTETDLRININIVVPYQIIRKFTNICQTANTTYIRTYGRVENIYADEYIIMFEYDNTETKSLNKNVPQISIVHSETSGIQGKALIGIGKIMMDAEVCPFDCLTCTSTDKCLTCPDQSYLSNGRCLCIPGYVNGYIHYHHSLGGGNYLGQCVTSSDITALRIPSIDTQKVQMFLQRIHAQYQLTEMIDQSKGTQYFNLTAKLEYEDDLVFTGSNYDDFPINDIIVCINMESKMIYAQSDKAIYQKTKLRFPPTMPENQMFFPYVNKLGVQFEWNLPQNKFEIIIPYEGFSTIKKTRFLRENNDITYAYNDFSFFFQYVNGKDFQSYGTRDEYWRFILYQVQDANYADTYNYLGNYFSSVFVLNIKGMSSEMKGVAYFCQDLQCQESTTNDFFFINKNLPVQVMLTNPYAEGKLIIQSVNYKIGQSSNAQWKNLVNSKQLYVQDSEVILILNSRIPQFGIGESITVKINGYFQTEIVKNGRRVLGELVKLKPIIKQNLKIMEGPADNWEDYGFY